MAKSGILLREIRDHEGSQARAWEELAYQLRPPVGDGWVETRKTRAPDGGVEWYEVYEDGHHEGFQAKFNEKLEDALGGMLESVKSVAAKRPEMTRLTFLVPYDFTDAASPRSKSDQDRWDEAVERWRTDIEGGDRLRFDVIRAGDIVAALTRAENAGRLSFWFNHVELTDDWLRKRWNESVKVAGDRYTPAADTTSHVEALLDAVCATPDFLARTASLTERVLVACRQDPGMWSALVTEVDEHLAAIEAVRRDTLGQFANSSLIPTAEIDFAALAEAATALVDAAIVCKRELPTCEQRNLDQALTTASALSDFAASQSARLYAARTVAIEGPAGQGKTHALIKVTETLLDAGAPAIVVLGQRLRESNWWPAMSAVLGSPTATSDEFLDALETLAEARGCRAVIVVDALNEARDPRMWRTELASLLAQIETRHHLALVVSYRTDYRDTLSPPRALPRVRHPGLAGHESDALAAYCHLYGIPVPPTAALGSSFSSPLFLRMYCAVVSADKKPGAEPPTRSTLFSRFAALQAERVRDALNLPPSTAVVGEAITLAADLLLANRGQAVPRPLMEERVDRLLPGRAWPDTLFQRLVSEGLLELRPDYLGNESVAFPFQAYSEQLLASRLLEADTNRSRGFSLLRLIGRPSVPVTRALRNTLRKERWLWRAMGVLLPETRSVELIDLFPGKATDDRLVEATRESLVDRAPSSFSRRTLRFLDGELRLEGEDWVDAVLALAPQEGHIANADWLHSKLVSLPLPDRDASWSIDTFQADDLSPAFERLAGWADRGAPGASAEQIRLACAALMWLLTSSNRFLRDRSSRCLVALLAGHLAQAADLLERAREVNDPYVQERVLACIYGAVMVGGDDRLAAVRRIVDLLEAWTDAGLPVHAVARDSARGIAYWAHSRGLARDEFLNRVSPPYGAEPPDEPPTADELRERYGYIKNDAGEYVEWRASTILMSCLDWMGDFNKYVVDSDVGFFSRYPLAGPAPTKKYDDPAGEVDADWAGRWIANRAIEFGWTAERFEEFERSHNLRKGRDSHKAERIGKKYQWIAHQELLARLADNFHPAHESWNPKPMIYEGPWPWYGRDFDPSLPPAERADGQGACKVESGDEGWAALASPDMRRPADAKAWVARTDDLPAAKQMFVAVDLLGRDWVALQRYSTWGRDNSARRGMTKRELDVFFLQFSWLTPAGDGQRLHELIVDRGLGGRWMRDIGRPYTQYLGEQGWSPVVRSTARAAADEEDLPRELREVGLTARPAVEQYLWEGHVLDCSIDESVDFYVPTDELLGDARWVGFTAQWRTDDLVIAKAVRIHDWENGQGALLVDREWLDVRLSELGAELVVGTLSEKHARAEDDDDYRNMALSDICYSALVVPGASIKTVGPVIKVRDLAAERRAARSATTPTNSDPAPPASALGRPS